MKLGPSFASASAVLLPEIPECRLWRGTVAQRSCYHFWFLWHLSVLCLQLLVAPLLIVEKDSYLLLISLINPYGFWQSIWSFFRTCTLHFPAECRFHNSVFMHSQNLSRPSKFVELYRTYRSFIDENSVSSLVFLILQLPHSLGPMVHLLLSVFSAFVFLWVTMFHFHTIFTNCCFVVSAILSICWGVV